MTMLKREQIVKINESVLTGDNIWIHFPIVGDLTKCNVIKSTRDKVLLSIPTDSDLCGCPDFWFKKINIVGKA